MSVLSLSSVLLLLLCPGELTLRLLWSGEAAERLLGWEERRLGWGRGGRGGRGGGGGSREGGTVGGMKE